MISAAGATPLFGTIGYGGSSWNPWQGYCPTETTCYNTSYLVQLNPETGAVIDYIGEVGYRVNGLAFDPTSGRLYGGTSPRDPNFIGLIEIDITTGAGTRVGTGWSNVSHVAAITVNPGGQMYGWTEDSDDLVSIDKTTGVATIVGDSGIWTGDHGLSFNSAGELYLVLYQGLTYRVDTSTGAATLEESFYDYGDTHHGKFDWLTDLFYTISWSQSGTRDLYRCDRMTQYCTLIGPVGTLHTIAFQDQLGTTQYALSVNKAGAATGTVKSSPAGITCGADCSQDYFAGRVVTLHAFADLVSAFAGWSGDADCADGVVTMDSAKSCTATFAVGTVYDLSVSKSGTGTGIVTSRPPGGIDCGSDCSESYNAGTSVMLFSSDGENSLFAGWSGDADCSDGIVTMDSARSCTATFNLKPTHTLSVSKSGTGTGSVVSHPAGISCGSDCSEDYYEDTWVWFESTASEDSVFAGWSGDADCSDGDVTVISAMSCTAIFNLKPTYALSISKAGTGTGTVTSAPAGISCGADCSESYIDGTWVTLTAAASASSVFAGWSGAEHCGDGMVQMTAATSCTAAFNSVIAVTAPNGGEAFTVGTEYTISWTYTNAVNEGTYVNIDLLKGGVVDKKIASRVSIGTSGVGSLTWTPRGKLSGTDYSIRVTSKSNASYTDTSDANFTIASRR